jgi:RNA polymerase sigma-70 factor (ECF subfamily)
MQRREDQQLELELTWLQGLRNSDLEVFRQIFEFYVLRLRRYAAASNISSDVGEDMIQEIFVSVWDRRENLPVAPGDLGRYLIGALHKKILQYKRNASLRSEIVGRYSEDIKNLSSSPPKPDAPLLSAELNAVFLRALSELSEIQRQILALRWGEEMPFAKIAEILGISENAAMLHASRIKAVLRPLLQRYLQGLQ